MFQKICRWLVAALVVFALGCGSGDMTPSSYDQLGDETETAAAAAVAAAVPLDGSCRPAPSVFVAKLTGSQVVPPNASTAVGNAVVVLSPDETGITVVLQFSGIATGTSSGGAHIHGPAAPGTNNAILFNFSLQDGIVGASALGRHFLLTPQQVAELKAGQFYIDVHSPAFPAGEIRAQLAPPRPSSLFVTTLSSAQEVTPNSSLATGKGVAVLLPDESLLALTIDWSGLSSNAFAAHVHGVAPVGSNAAILFDQPSLPLSTGGSSGPWFFSLTQAQVAQLRSGLMYADVHSSSFPSGEIRGQLSMPNGNCAFCEPLPKVFTTTLSGAQQVPSNGSAGTGTAAVILSPNETSMAVSLTFSGLGSSSTSAHIHGPAAPGTSAAILFTLNPGLGSNGGTVINSSFALTPAQAAQLKAGQLYVDVHSSSFPAGELRGQLVPPSTSSLFTGSLSSAQEVTPASSFATGKSIAVLSPNGSTLAVSLDYSGLSADASSAHVHGPAAAGSSAAILFNLPPATFTNGIGPLFFGVDSTQVSQLVGGLYYTDVHTASFPAGEIRGQLLAPSHTCSLCGGVPCPSPIALAPTADAFVRDGSSAGTNFGSSTTLNVKTSSAGFNRDTYMKFDLTSATNVVSAKLRFTARSSDSSAITLAAFPVADSSWIESTINWNTRPALGTSQLSSVTVTGNALATYELDVTGFVQNEKAAGRNLISIGLHSPTSTSALAGLNSREAAANVPQLVLTTASSSNPIADAHVRDGSSAGTNFGTAQALELKTSTSGFNRDGYLKFALTGASNITSAKLRFFATSSQGTAIPIAAFPVSDTSWSETAITWNNRPARGATQLGSVTVNGAALARYEIDVTSYLRSEKALGHSLVTIGLHATSSTTTLATMNSREAAGNRPELVITN
jgi:CHRD domain